MSGADNAFSFPLERRVRPELALLHARMAVAASIIAASPFTDLREDPDAATTASEVHEPAVHGMLHELGMRAVAAAIAVCGTTEEAMLAALKARLNLSRSQPGDCALSEQLRKEAVARTRRVADLLTIAYARADIAEAIARRLKNP